MNQQLNNLLEVGEIVLEDGISGHHILFLSIIGEIEGHNLSFLFWQKHRIVKK